MRKPHKNVVGFPLPQKIEKHHIIVVTVPNTSLLPKKWLSNF